MTDLLSITESQRLAKLTKGGHQPRDLKLTRSSSGAKSNLFWQFRKGRQTLSCL